MDQELIIIFGTLGHPGLHDTLSPPLPPPTTTMTTTTTPTLSAFLNSPLLQSESISLPIVFFRSIC